MKIYIAGGITGILNYRFNFKIAENRLSNMGHIVINPAYLPDGLKDYMSICKSMIDECDAIYLLKNWEYSAGATEEKNYAENKRLKIFMEGIS